MTDYSTLVVEQDGPILWVRINRPEAMNAYTATMGAELAAAFGHADARIRSGLLS
jgi:enoyl-CoA hydratase/carnithine racemase